MSVDKKPERSHHETLALIADKLAIERPNTGRHGIRHSAG